MEALPYYLTLTFSWFYIPFGDNALIYQLGLIASVAWSISTEWFFYFIYPAVRYGLVLLPRTRHKLCAAAVVCVVATCLVVAVGHFATPINDFAVERFGDVADVRLHWQDSFLRWLLYFSPYSRVFHSFVASAAAIYLDRADRAPTSKENGWGLRIRRSSRDGGLPAGVLLCAISFRQRRASSRSDSAHLHWLYLSFGIAPPIAIIIFSLRAL